MEKESRVGSKMQARRFAKHETVNTFSVMQWASFGGEGEMEVSLSWKDEQELWTYLLLTDAGLP